MNTNNVHRMSAPATRVPAFFPAPGQAVRFRRRAPCALKGDVSHFKDLSQNGNSTCSGKFTESIATMPAMSRITGSCCSPVEMKRYGEHVNGLAKYRDIAMIPSDPYDIPAGIAQSMMPYYDVKLTNRNSRHTIMRWQIPKRRDRAAANAGAGKYMADWRNT
ncbi:MULTISPECIES: hypothetical protein [unclassified Mesorhizobium]|uniref:hypothetical protein n=1 Tax=unclassified Mesorhizobium TaxID=325217 RepID=UPI0033358EDE